MVIDTHLHLFKEYYDNLDEIIKEMGNNLMIVNGINNETNIEVLELIQKYKNVYGALGIHPSEASNYKSEDLDFIKQKLSNLKIVAVGEIGLDYYWTKDNKEEQKQLFINQIKIAKEFNKPVIIHCRDAVEDVYEILKKEYEEKKFKIIMHCFSYSLDWALKFIELDALLGIGGSITFPKSEELRRVVMNIPLEHIILETDSPYMTPVPHRGKKNKPINVMFVAEKIAEIRKVSVEEVINTTTSNALRQFDLDI